MPPFTFLTRVKGAIYFAIDPSAGIAKGLPHKTLTTRKFDDRIAEEIDQDTLMQASDRYMMYFNKAVPEAVRTTMYTRTGNFSSPGHIEMYMARKGRRSTPSILRIKADERVPQAVAQELGRDKKTDTPTIQGSGRNWSIGGGPLYYVPLFSYFGRKGVVPMEDIRGKEHFIARKVFHNGTRSYLMAFEKTPKRSRASVPKVGPGGKKRRAASITKDVWKAMFMIFVGQHTGIPGYSNSKYAKMQRSPGRWFSMATHLAATRTIASFAGGWSKRRLGSAAAAALSVKVALALGFTMDQIEQL